MDRQTIITIVLVIFIIILILSDRKKKPDKDYEQAVLVKCNVKQDVKAVQLLSNNLDKTLSKTGEGKYDGHAFELKSDKATMYMYGADAKKILNIIKPVLVASELKPFDIELQFGPADNKATKTEKLKIH